MKSLHPPANSPRNLSRVIDFTLMATPLVHDAHQQETYTHDRHYQTHDRHYELCDSLRLMSKSEAPHSILISSGIPSVLTPACQKNDTNNSGEYPHDNVHHEP
jgi:hypothetical protein